MGEETLVSVHLDNLSPEDSFIHINLSSKTRAIEIREAADFDNHG